MRLMLEDIGSPMSVGEQSGISSLVVTGVSAM
jgi:hypothetical protein